MNNINELKSDIENNIGKVEKTQASNDLSFEHDSCTEQTDIKLTPPEL